MSVGGVDRQARNGENLFILVMEIESVQKAAFR